VGYEDIAGTGEQVAAEMGSMSLQVSVSKAPGWMKTKPAGIIAEKSTGAMAFSWGCVDKQLGN
jgi:hypothetical protein